MKNKLSSLIHWGLLLLILVLLPGGQALAVGKRPVERMVSEPVFGGEMLVREAGQEHDEMVLLVHGLGDEAGTTWDGILDGLSRHYHVIAPDLPGFGRSSKGNHLYSPENYARVLHHLVVSLPPKPLALVGHSLGGGVSMVYAAQYGLSLRHLVLVDSVGILHRLAVSQYYTKEQIKFDVPLVAGALETALGRFSDLLLEKTSRIPVDPYMALKNETMRAKLLDGDPSRIAALALVGTDYSLLLDRINTPTWLLWGSEDRIAALRIARALQWMLPQAELKMLDGLGHCPMIEDPPGFLAALKTALSRSPQALAEPAQRDNAPDGYCQNENGRVFQGNYKTLKISGCKEVRLLDVTMQRLDISDSEVEVEHARIKAGIHVTRSRLTVTGADIHGETGIVTDQSRLDLAGVRFVDTPIAIRAKGNPSALLSSSSTRRWAGSKTAIHTSRSLKAGEKL